jgi:ABC-type phosphate transport system substrate-binding protein
MHMRLLLVGAVAACVLGASAPAPPRVFVVVVHVDNPSTTIARDQLSKIFLKRANKWPNGNPVMPVDLASGSAARAAFTKTVHGKSVTAVVAFWQQQIFSGRDVPPPEKASEKDVVEFINGHPGAVGYVSAGAMLGDSVKTLQIDGNAP